ncbi:MAG TPA: hypothetical protein PK453_25500 [Leptospiraceae bacterium]|nr:hypothetical protein [Leptospiraceae bacterium]HNF17037.1 hypothetical protein [Leptospiraceae bacterium]HNF24813.1 hypothetical protein [Leptospiraceae bacterium]HNI28289.1 hypothetical protein [Leptospiraceae bacterium]HNI99784.1 hypothetical protein [Leptospiraceae bacterium]
MKKTLQIFFTGICFILFFSRCSMLDSTNPNLISDAEAKKILLSAALVKCSQSGGSSGNYASVYSFIAVLFSGTSTIASPDRSSIYYKKTRVRNCALEILAYSPPAVCDFGNFITADYVSNKKLCNLTPDRTVKLDIISNK